ncbi:hypothetical protein HDV63DRAFT_385133 [Trichoderma sp. SZMC 28014]
MDPVLPKPDYFRDLEWYWPFARLALDPNDLFTTLHDRFNTRPFPLLDPIAFHRDVFECADSSDTTDEFYSRLEERKAQRIEEMSKAWREVSTLLGSFSDLLACQMCYDPETRDMKMPPGTKNDSVAERQFAFSQYARCRSFDNLIVFFDGFVRDKREEQERNQRRADEAIEMFRMAQAAERAAAASGSVEATSSGSTHRTSSRRIRNKVKSSRNAPLSTSQSPETSATATEKPATSSSSRRIGPLQADRLSPGHTVESSRTGKRKIDEDAPRSTGKRRRMSREDVGAENIDTERPATGQDQSEVPETASTARRGKRKSRDDSPSESKRKRARIIDSPIKRSRQSPRRSTNQDQPGRAPSSTERDSSIPSTAVPSDYNLEGDEERIQKKPSVLEPNTAFYIEEHTQSPSDRATSAVNAADRSPSILSEIPNMTQIPEQYDDGHLYHFQDMNYIIDPNRAFDMEEPDRSPSRRNPDMIHAGQEIPQADEDQLTHGLVENATTADADTKSLTRKRQKKPRASNRQRVDKRRSVREQKPPAPKKQSRRKNAQERNPSPPPQRLLRSARSSRRNTGQELWFLGDDSVAHAVGNTRRT